MLPILQKIDENGKTSMTDIKALMSKLFNLSESDKKKLLPSGTQTIFENRVGWARTYLKKAGLVTIPQRGYVEITKQGKQTLSENLKEINLSYLKKFPEFIKFQTVTPKENTNQIKEDADTNPIERIEQSFHQINEELKKELLSILVSCSPAFFERFVVDLLLNMGYGGSRKEAGIAFTTTGDEGIDGMIKEDKLGLDLIYIQAKRWKESTVGRPEIQKFAGALQGKKAKKGIFITTSRFSSEAEQFVKGIESNIVLIDGAQIANLMINSDTGVSVVQKFEIKRPDQDYFTED